MCRPEGHHPYPTAKRATNRLLSFRGLHGLSLVPDHPSKEQSATPTIECTGLRHSQLRFNLSKAESILATYTRIGCFLDNDTAGRNAYANLQRMLGDRLQDMSVHYAGYNDLNEYLCKKLLSQSTEPIKEEKQVQSARRMMQPPKKKGLKI